MLAIIIPYYKLTFFEETLKSLANQTDQRFRVYIGDDASPENPTDLLEGYKGKFDFDCHRFEVNIGGISLTKQWERCIALSGKEEWLMILGDDDYLSNNFIAKFYENLNLFHENYNVLRFATTVIDKINNKKMELFTNPLFETGIEYISRKIRNKTRGSLSQFVFKKSELLKYKFINYPSAFYSDDRIVLDISENKNIFSINDAVVYVTISIESVSGKAELIGDKLFLARFQFYEYLFSNKFELFDNLSKKVIIERLLSYAIQFKKYSILLFLNLYFKSLILFEFMFFYKINKKFIKIILNRSID